MLTRIGLLIIRRAWRLRRYSGGGLILAYEHSGILHYAREREFLKLSLFVNGIRDRHIRLLAMALVRIDKKHNQIVLPFRYPDIQEIQVLGSVTHSFMRSVLLRLLIFSYGIAVNWKCFFSLFLNTPQSSIAGNYYEYLFSKDAYPIKTKSDLKYWVIAEFEKSKIKILFAFFASLVVIFFYRKNANLGLVDVFARWLIDPLGSALCAEYVRKKNFDRTPVFFNSFLYEKPTVSELWPESCKAGLYSTSEYLPMHQTVSQAAGVRFAGARAPLIWARFYFWYKNQDSHFELIDAGAKRFEVLTPSSYNFENTAGITINVDDVPKLEKKAVIFDFRPRKLMWHLAYDFPGRRFRLSDYENFIRYSLALASQANLPAVIVCKREISTEHKGSEPLLKQISEEAGLDRREIVDLTEVSLAIGYGMSTPTEFFSLNHVLSLSYLWR